eukprot:2596333-Amphidinium_carterae.1
MTTDAEDDKKTLIVFEKTRMCHFYQHGCCSRGSQCVFAHLKSELRPAPDFACTRLCPRFRASGSCAIAGCTFAHNREELRRRKSTKEEVAQRKARQQTARASRVHLDSDDVVAASFQ